MQWAHIVSWSWIKTRMIMNGHFFFCGSMIKALMIILYPILTIIRLPLMSLFTMNRHDVMMNKSEINYFNQSMMHTGQFVQCMLLIINIIITTSKLFTVTGRTNRFHSSIDTIYSHDTTVQLWILCLNYVETLNWVYPIDWGYEYSSTPWVYLFTFI